MSISLWNDRQQRPPSLLNPLNFEPRTLNRHQTHEHVFFSTLITIDRDACHKTFSSCKIQENLSGTEVLWKFLKRGSF